MILTLLKLLGCIALLMYGMKVMSEALQKMAGPGLRHILGAMTTNRFTGVLTGMLVCVAVQSSAATTLMTVSFVNAALLSLAQAIAENDVFEPLYARMLNVGIRSGSSDEALAQFSEAFFDDAVSQIDHALALVDVGGGQHRNGQRKRRADHGAYDGHLDGVQQRAHQLRGVGGVLRVP